MILHHLDNNNWKNRTKYFVLNMQTCTLPSGCCIKPAKSSQDLFIFCAIYQKYAE